jgi:hypothetical protein
MYPQALVLGSQKFYEKYPLGLRDDPSTAASPEWLAANPGAVHKKEKKTKALTKDAAIKSAKATGTSAAASAAGASAAASAEASAATSAEASAAKASAEASAAKASAATPPSAAKAADPYQGFDDSLWNQAFVDCRMIIYEVATGKAFPMKTGATDAKSYEDLADRTEFLGRYDAATEAMDPYGLEGDE